MLAVANAHGATKAFVRQFTRICARIYTGTAVRVTDIEPSGWRYRVFSVRFKGDET